MTKGGGRHGPVVLELPLAVGAKPFRVLGDKTPQASRRVAHHLALEVARHQKAPRVRVAAEKVGAQRVEIGKLKGLVHKGLRPLHGSAHDCAPLAALRGAVRLHRFAEVLQLLRHHCHRRRFLPPVPAP